MKNGDKIFSEATAVVVPKQHEQDGPTVLWRQDQPRYGKFTGITGLMRGTNSFDLKGYNEAAPT